MMVEVRFTQPDGSVEKVYARAGTSVMEAAMRIGVPGIRGECGGSCACATCHVVVAPDWRAKVGPAHEAEDQLMDGLDTRQEGSRLSCQIKLRAELDGLVVTAPDGVVT